MKGRESQYQRAQKAVVHATSRAGKTNPVFERSVSAALLTSTIRVVFRSNGPVVSIGLGCDIAGVDIE